MARKPLSKRIRFDVFKRDKFICAYCGATPPKAVLEADHVIPVAEGGTDDIDNLVTSCRDCNQGKGARKLGAAPRPGVSVEAIAEVQERAAQLAAYREMVEELEAERGKVSDVVMDAWCRAFGGERTETGWTFHNTYPAPNWLKSGGVMRYVDAIGLEAVLRAVQVAADAGHVGWGQRDRYFYGVCRRMGQNQEDAIADATAAAVVTAEETG